ncbi:MAG: CBS domain-containing protein [Cohaesibacter sp.]|jgi:CBS domain-containing protein|nr:CBS domain-containing protein [Cohaesibacter sp.]
MAPVSYQGPRANEAGQASSSQDSNLAYEKVKSETNVASILSDKGVTVFAITETTSIAAATTELTIKKIGVLPVIDSQGGLVGILSERDIVRAFAECEAGQEQAVLSSAVREIMTPDPITCTTADKVTDLMEIMTEKRFRHMPVMQGGMLCGIISIRDLVDSRLTELELETLKIKQLMVG